MDAFRVVLSLVGLCMCTVFLRTDVLLITSAVLWWSTRLVQTHQGLKL